MRSLRNLSKVLMILMMLLIMPRMLLANTGQEIWINERNNVEMTQPFFMDLMNKLKYESVMHQRFKESLMVERKTYEKEREAFLKEREEWKKLEKELNEYSHKLARQNKLLEWKLDTYKKVGTVLLIAGGVALILND